MSMERMAALADQPEPSIRDEFSVDWLDYHARYDADVVAAVDVDTGRSFTYGEFNDRLRRLAVGLKSAYGLEKGDRIAMLCQNSTDVFETLFAGWELGAALMPLNWRLSAREIAAILNHGEPSVVICDEEFGHLVEGTGLPKLERRSDPADSEYEQLIESESGDALERAHLTIDDLATLLYTSGTTGMPKGVIGTFRMMRDTIIHAALHGDLTASSRSLTCAPMFHSAGLYGFSMPVFHYGGTLCVMKKWDPRRFLGMLTDAAAGITHCLGVPVQYAMMAELPEFAEAEFPTLRVAGVGAAPVSTDLLAAWAAKGVHLAQSYGLTEAFSVAILPPRQAAGRVGSAGHRMMHTRLRIADEAGDELPDGEVGEIQIKGPAVTPGYWKAPEETARAFVDGWFRTGDAGRLAPDGTLYIVDRYKDMYISGGENVYPAEVENVLCELPEVAAAAVVGVADEKWGQAGLAAIRLRAGASADPDELLAHCADRLARYKLPKYVRFVEALPMSAQGKVLKQELKRLYDPAGSAGGTTEQRK
ncbi:AMP-binding protein [Lentisalinibacter salinarum]|uniref:AMP-binding protein n=1 Tax=Lentisalinibacter salinarum TaxID=2992239 RepID=UPI003866529E